MMPARKMTGMIVRNTLRSKKHFILSLFGIVVGIAAFVFFLGLSKGVEDLLHRIYPIDQIEVRPKRAVSKIMEATLDDSTVEMLKAEPRVKNAIPRMQLAMPASGVGWFEGQEIRLFLESVIDGIDSSAITNERSQEMFKDWDQYPTEPCIKSDEPKCPAGATFGDLDAQGRPLCKYHYSCSNDERYYCDRSDYQCHHRVPVVLSPDVLEMCNRQFARGNDLPAITGDLDNFIEKRGAKKMRFHITLGVGMNKRKLLAPPKTVEATIVGMDPAAMKFGATVPIQYIKRWRTQYLGEESAKSYSSILVTVHKAEQVAPLISWLEKEHGLTNDNDEAQVLSTILFVVTLILLTISLIIVTISAINIAHNFFMQVSERRREIGILRAVGATRYDVMGIILGESAVIGLIGGLLGIGVAVGLGAAVDYASANYIGDFPYKPDTFFDFQLWILLGGLMFSILFCVLGGFLPARKASKMQPAEALST